MITSIQFNNNNIIFPWFTRSCPWWVALIPHTEFQSFESKVSSLINRTQENSNQNIHHTWLKIRNIERKSKFIIWFNSKYKIISASPSDFHSIKNKQKYYFFSCIAQLVLLNADTAMPRLPVVRCRLNCEQMQVTFKLNPMTGKNWAPDSISHGI